MTKPGYGKQKGSAFERVVAKKLSLWLSDGLHDDVLWRSAVSGGRATLQLKKDIANRTQLGDLSAVASEGFDFIEQFIVEIKHYKQLDVASGLLKRTGILYGFWIKLKKDAEKANKRPLLVAKQNNFPTLLILNQRSTLNDKFAVQALPVLTSALWRADFYLFDDFLKSQKTYRRA